MLLWIYHHPGWCTCHSTYCTIFTRCTIQSARMMPLHHAFGIRFLMLQEPVGSAAILHAMGSATEQLLQPGCAAAQLWASQAFTWTTTSAWVPLEVVQQAIVILLHDADSQVRTMLQSAFDFRLLSSVCLHATLAYVCISCVS